MQCLTIPFESKQPSFSHLYILLKALLAWITYSINFISFFIFVKNTAQQLEVHSLSTIRDASPKDTSSFGLLFRIT